jgi:hypothetical protein
MERFSGQWLAFPGTASYVTGGPTRAKSNVPRAQVEQFRGIAPGSRNGFAVQDARPKLPVDKRSTQKTHVEASM